MVMVLEYVKDQTEYICLAAISQSGSSLRYVRNQTEASCIAAVKRDQANLKYVEKYYESVASLISDPDYLALAEKNQEDEIILNGKTYVFEK